MARPKGNGIKRVLRRRADGSVHRIDYYDARSLRFLGNSLEAAQAALGQGSQVATPPGGAGGRAVTFGELVTRYLGSPEYRALAPSTAKLNRLYLDQLRARYGDLPAAAITSPVVRALRDAHAAQPTKGNRLIATLRLILGYGVTLGILAKNAASRPGRLPERPRRAVFDDEQIDRFLAAASPTLRRAMALLFWTVQRPGDVLAMGPQHLAHRDGRWWITLRQAKTGELVDVPLHQRAAAILAEPLPPPTSRRAPAVVSPALLVPSPTGRAWTYRNFSRAWDRAQRRADHRLAREVIAAWPARASRTAEQTDSLKAALRARLLAGLQRRDLRRSGMVRMALAGATTAQIAAVSGHTIDHVQRILDVYIPRRGEVAAAAIAAWEAGDSRGQVISLPTRRR